MILTGGMAHPRKLIRQAVVALLIAANTAAGTRVKGTRVDPIKKTDLPAIGVYTLNDAVVEDDSTETEEAHEIELEVACWVADTEALSMDDAMDDIADQVETAMKVDPYLGGKSSDLRLVGTTMEAVEENGRVSPTIGIAVLTYAVKYRSSLTADASALDDFTTVVATQKITGGVPDPGGTVPASDQFTVQEP